MMNINVINLVLLSEKNFIIFNFEVIVEYIEKYDIFG